MHTARFQNGIFEHQSQHGRDDREKKSSFLPDA